jgi:predicted dehydrogenase
MLRRRYGLVGTGMRAGMYVHALTSGYAEVGELAALADVNEGRLGVHAQRVVESGFPRPTLYHPDQLEAMIATQRLDRVIITSPDYTHAELIVRALDAGADVIVEKPLTIDEAGCKAIAAATARTGRSVVMTFNYRYAPRNCALKQVAASGAIGHVTSVHFEWLLDTSHGADYFRRWHRNKKNSGGLLIHKASHHFDLVNWWIADEPVRVFASGGLRFYGRANAQARGLGDRPQRGSVDGWPPDPFMLDLRSDPELNELYYLNEHFDGYLRDQDVFSEGITIEDNLSLVVDFAAGASMSYSLNAHSPWEGYNVRINGAQGSVELSVVERGTLSNVATIDPGARPEASTGSASRGKVVRPIGEQLLLQRHWQDAQVIAIESGEGGHGGGDENLLRDVFRGPRSDPLGRPASWRDGIRAVCVGIAANESLRSGSAVSTAATLANLQQEPRLS